MNYYEEKEKSRKPSEVFFLFSVLALIVVLIITVILYGN